MTKLTDIAEYFGKQHGHVLRDIGNLERLENCAHTHRLPPVLVCPLRLGEFCRSNFGSTQFMIDINLPIVAPIAIGASTPPRQKADNRPMAKSTDIAAYFGKQHKDVLRSIADLERLGEFWRRNFAPRDYVDVRGKTQPMVEMTKDGFVFLAMGYAGEKADQFKIAYINEFNRMEAALRGQTMPNISKLMEDIPLPDVFTPEGIEVCLRPGITLANSLGDSVAWIIESSHVAWLFDRPHSPLLKRIRNLVISPRLHQRHFEEGIPYTAQNGHELPQINMSRDGFTMATANWRCRRDTGIKEAVYHMFDLKRREERRKAFQNLLEGESKWSWETRQLVSGKGGES